MDYIYFQALLLVPVRIVNSNIVQLYPYLSNTSTSINCLLGELQECFFVWCNVKQLDACTRFIKFPLTGFNRSTLGSAGITMQCTTRLLSTSQLKTQIYMTHKLEDKYLVEVFKDFQLDLI